VGSVDNTRRYDAKHWSSLKLEVSNGQIYSLANIFRFCRQAITLCHRGKSSLNHVNLSATASRAFRKESPSQGCTPQAYTNFCRRKIPPVTSLHSTVWQTVTTRSWLKMHKRPRLNLRGLLCSRKGRSGKGQSGGEKGQLPPPISGSDTGYCSKEVWLEQAQLTLTQRRWYKIRKIHTRCCFNVRSKD